MPKYEIDPRKCYPTAEMSISQGEELGGDTASRVWKFDEWGRLTIPDNGNEDGLEEQPQSKVDDH